jgi:aspartyl-tRNA(Asn)/glutamyl-tRNA(Gln) amidotransferase subunit C
MQGVDTTGVQPMSHAVDTHVPDGQRLRPDEVKEGDQRAAYQSVAPAVEEGLYLVPKVIE